MSAFQDNAFQSNAFDAGLSLSAAGVDAAVEINDAKTFSGDKGVNAAGVGLTAAVGDAALAKRTVLTVEAGEYGVAGSNPEILAPERETFHFNVIVDLIPAAPNHQRFTEELTVDGQILPVISWVYEESRESLTGNLQIELVDPNQRGLITRNSSVDFSVGVWNGTGYDFTSLLSTGYLESGQYRLSRPGVGSPDRFTFTALNELTSRLNRCPPNNLIYYNTSRLNVAADDFEGWYDVAGAYHAPTVTGVGNLTYRRLLNIFASLCGFRDARTNIPDFPLGVVDFPKGKPYVETMNGLIGMFDADYDVENVAGGLRLWVRDGTSGNPPSFPAPRTVPISRASALGVDTDVQRIDSLELSISQERYAFDYYGSRRETATEVSGGIETVVTTTYRDFFRNSQTAPVKSEIASVRRKSYSGSTEISRTIENFAFDNFGRTTGRTKKTMMLIPVTTTATFWTYLTAPAAQPVDQETSTNEAGDQTTTRTFANGTTETTTEYAAGGSQSVVRNANGDTTTATTAAGGGTTTETTLNEEVSTTRFIFVKVSDETEVIVYANHPYEPRQYYIKSRETNKEGLVFIDGENQQQGEDYVQELMSAYLSGNVQDTHQALWTDISTQKEEITPQRDKKVRVKLTEIDYLLPPAGSMQYREEIRDGEIGVNVFVVEQKKVVLFAEGQTAINGFTDSVNMGELPLNTAAALGNRIILNQNSLPNVVNLELIGIDPTLTKGSEIKATGRNSEDLGNYAVEARTLRGERSGYFTSLQAKQIDD